MKKYTDKNGRRVVEVDDLSYLVEREHPYNWFQRHFHHHRLRIALKKADLVIASSPEVATDLLARASSTALSIVSATTKPPLGMK